MNQCDKCESKSIIIEKHYEYWNLFRCANCEYWTFWLIEDCCRNPEKIVSIDIGKNSKRTLYHQCLNCGGAAKKKPLSFKKYGEEIRSEFSEYRFSEYTSNKETERKQIAELKAEYRNINSSAYKYHRYLISGEWKRLADKVKERDKYLCQECKENKAEEVHHKTYENIFNEKLEDLVSVCSDCHRELHNRTEKTV